MRMIHGPPAAWRLHKGHGEAAAEALSMLRVQALGQMLPVKANANPEFPRIACAARSLAEGQYLGDLASLIKHGAASADVPGWRLASGQAGLRQGALEQPQMPVGTSSGVGSAQPSTWCGRTCSGTGRHRAGLRLLSGLQQ